MKQLSIPTEIHYCAFHSQYVFITDNDSGQKHNLSEQMLYF